MIRLLPPAAIIAAILAAISLSAHARQDSPRLDHRLENSPLHVEALGLALHPPAAAQTAVQRVGERVIVTLRDGAAVPAWSISIQLFVSRLQEPSADAEIDRQLDLWTSAGRRFRLAAREEVHYGGTDGRLCWIVQEDPEATEAIAHGWMFLSMGDYEFLTFNLQALADALPQVRSLLDASFSTIELLSLKELVAQRKSRLDAGGDLLSRLTRHDLEGLTGREQLFRFYTPAALTGEQDQERGYLHVSFREGVRGEVNPQRSERDFDAAERQPGLLVTVRGRYLDTAPGAIYDSEGLYWVSWDLSEETWSIRGTHRYGKNEQSEALSGIRMPRTTGDPHGRVVVISSGKSASGRDQRNWQLPEVYLPQALRWALGYLLPRDPAEPQTISYYCVDTSGSDMSLSLRVDEWTPVADSSGRWKLTSRSRSDAPAVTTVFDEEGNLLRREWPDGSVTEPIELRELRRIWDAKGLLTDDVP